MKTTSTEDIATIEPSPLGLQCAAVLVARSLISSSNSARAAEIATLYSADPLRVATELCREGVLHGQNGAAAAEFIKRAVRRFG